MAESAGIFSVLVDAQGWTERLRLADLVCDQPAIQAHTVLIDHLLRVLRYRAFALPAILASISER